MESIYFVNIIFDNFFALFFSYFLLKKLAIFVSLLKQLVEATGIEPATF